jgi:hypothetical protein
MAVERSGVVIAAVIAAAITAGAIGWALGRAGAPESTTDSRGAVAMKPAAITTIGQIPVGVQHNRAGALAAADNYVVIASEALVQDPRRYENLVRRVYVPGYQATALREGRQARQADPESIAGYSEGWKTVGTIGARRLDSYSSAGAQVTTWIAGVTWGPGRKPDQRWQLVETNLRWDGQRWLVRGINEAPRAAPAPTIVRFKDKSAFSGATFDRELRGMAAPTYGGD